MRDRIENTYDEVLFLEPGKCFDHAILGVTFNHLGSPVVVYDVDKCIDGLVKCGITDYDEAKEYFEFNILEAGYGELTPVFVETCW